MLELKFNHASKRGPWRPVELMTRYIWAVVSYTCVYGFSPFCLQNPTEPYISRRNLGNCSDYLPSLAPKVRKHHRGTALSDYQSDWGIIGQQGRTHYSMIYVSPNHYIIFIVNLRFVFYSLSYYCSSFYFTGENWLCIFTYILLVNMFYVD